MEDDDQDRGGEEIREGVETLEREEEVKKRWRQRTIKHVVTCG